MCPGGVGCEQRQLGCQGLMDKQKDVGLHQQEQSIHLKQLLVFGAGA